MKVSIQQAANNAFAAWLEAKMVDVPVLPRWPQPDFQSPPQEISLVLAGRRQDTPIDLQLLSYSNVSTNQTKAVWQVAACEQPVQLDIWSDSDVGRDDIIARLDDFNHLGQSSLAVAGVNATPAGIGSLVAVMDGWDEFGTIADFVFESPDTDDTSDSQGRRIYRATYFGTAYFMLAVTSVTARQLAINFPLRLAEGDGNYTDFP